MPYKFSFCRIPPRALPPGSPGSITVYRSRARYDSLTLTLTLTVWILVAAIILLILPRALEEAAGTMQSAGLLALTVGIPLAALLAPLPFSPRGYELTASGIVVRRMLRSFEIPYGEIVEARRAGWSWKHLRLGGSGGLYGYFGLYTFKDLGRVWAYVTNRHNIVLIKTRSGAQYLLSPEDPDTFLKTLEAVIMKTEASSGS